jgi:hypothetical protein
MNPDELFLDGAGLDEPTLLAILRAIAAEIGEGNP